MLLGAPLNGMRFRLGNHFSHTGQGRVPVADLQKCKPVQVFDKTVCKNFHLRVHLSGKTLGLGNYPC